MTKNGNMQQAANKALSVFFVDDDKSYLYPLVVNLQKDGRYKIHCFTSGEECMKHLKLNPALVVLDLNLNPQEPNTMNGIDVLTHLHDLHPDTKVVMLSSRDNYQAVVETLKLGAYTYIIKDMEALDSLKKIINVVYNSYTRGPDRDVA